MPTRPKKGGSPRNSSTKAKRGGRKAVTGMSRSADVAQEAKAAVTDDEQGPSERDE